MDRKVEGRRFLGRDVDEEQGIDPVDEEQQQERDKQMLRQHDNPLHRRDRMMVPRQGWEDRLWWRRKTGYISLR